MDPQTSQPTAQKGRLDIISDAICPWCYIGKRQLERALPILAKDGLDFEVHWHPFQLNPDMPAQGVERSEYRRAKFGSAERSRQLDAQVAEAAAKVGLEIRHDLMRRTPNTVAAHRVIWLADRHGVQNAVVEALFRAYFTEGRDIGDPAALVEIAAGAGLDPDAVTAMLAGDEGRREVLGEDQMARGAGLNGVPTFTMSGHVLFSGAVPADTMAEAFGKAWRILSNRAA
ncbi:DsbA family oxidoreductase [Limobrevibacterium gyesilva]|uniref:DsbA family oxidoreductase n=1 Tax=Limobrevibacterium gyesilva TaxID=2991712 RepID=A0AA41YRG4_9PROT|nr:DsbA family oxidoreductase [Limobrevibacterium gyesilva]MCW3476953.1 DsbA family oxidoreductase [Limobrevibacterium gyesilva]